jgi:FkbM family methyltransferase
MLKSLLRTTLKQMGLEVRKLHSHHTDIHGDERRLLSGTPVRMIFDVGASEGISVTEYRRTYPEADVYCFEPTDAPFRLIQSRHGADPKVHPTKAAVGETPGEATFHLNAFDQTNSLLGRGRDFNASVGPTHQAELGTVTVPVVTLGDFCRDNRIEMIDLLKLDVQGFELGVLRGAAHLLGSASIRLIHCEVLFSKLYEGQAFYHDIAAFLAAYDYELWGIYNMLRLSSGALGWADAIFLSPALAENARSKSSGRLRGSTAIPS